jgi:hypothetical protein
MLAQETSSRSVFWGNLPPPAPCSRPARSSLTLVPFLIPWGYAPTIHEERRSFAAHTGAALSGCYELFSHCECFVEKEDI